MMSALGIQVAMLASCLDDQDLGDRDPALGRRIEVAGRKAAAREEQPVGRGRRGQRELERLGKRSVQVHAVTERREHRAEIAPDQHHLGGGTGCVRPLTTWPYMTVVDSPGPVVGSGLLVGSGLVVGFGSVVGTWGWVGLRHKRRGRTSAKASEAKGLHRVSSAGGIGNPCATSTGRWETRSVARRRHDGRDPITRLAGT